MVDLGREGRARTCESCRGRAKLEATKHSLKTWIVEALQHADGTMHHVRIAEHIWRHHEDELKHSPEICFSHGSMTFVGLPRAYEKTAFSPQSTAKGMVRGRCRPEAPSETDLRDRDERGSTAAAILEDLKQVAPFHVGDR